MFNPLAWLITMFSIIDEKIGSRSSSKESEKNIGVIILLVFFIIVVTLIILTQI